MNVPFVPGQKVDVPEIPFEESISLPAQKSAVIVVDMQNDFVKPDGNLVVPDASRTLANINRLLDGARAAEVPIVFTQDTHHEGDKEWETWPKHCHKGTWGWEIVDELAPHDGDLVFEKSRYDAFYDTGLDHYLSRVWDIEHLVIVGTVASICVLHTAASAGLRWFHVVLPADGISALTEFDQALALRQVSWLYEGHVVASVDDIQFVTE